MELREEIERVLLTDKALGLVRTCLEGEDASGFMVKIAKDGRIFYGSPVKENKDAKWRMRREAQAFRDNYFYEPLSEEMCEANIKIISPYVEEEFDRYKLGFNMNNLPSSKEDRILTSDIETVVIGKFGTNYATRQELKDYSAGNSELLTAAIPIIGELQLNFLRRDYPNQKGIFVLGEQRAERSARVELTAIQQKCSYLEPNDFVGLTILNLANLVNPNSRTRDALNKFYQTERGALYLKDGREKIKFNSSSSNPLGKMLEALRIS